MKKNSILFLLILTGPVIVSSQSLSPFVVSSSGGFYSNTNGQLSFTTGEMTMVNTFIAGSSILTQGFQQPIDLAVSIVEHEDPDFIFNVFPNPNNGTFSFHVNSKASSQPASIVIFDVIGRVIFRKGIVLGTGPQNFEIQLSEASQGIYLLEFQTDRNKLSRKIEIIR